MTNLLVVRGSNDLTEYVIADPSDVAFLPAQTYWGVRWVSGITIKEEPVP